MPYCRSARTPLIHLAFAEALSPALQEKEGAL